jgi:CheY-like chemotaxis protein
LLVAALVGIERRVYPRPQRVLVVDDTDDIRSLWKLWLSFWGFDVVEARNGDEAIRKAAEARPALILMDLWMPVLDGVTATQRLKRDPATADIPVIGVTAQSHEPWRSEALNAGAEMVLRKPLDPDRLLEQMRGVLARMRRQ